jgi:hypothetical protein
MRDFSNLLTLVLFGVFISILTSFLIQIKIETVMIIILLLSSLIAHLRVSKYKKRFLYVGIISVLGTIIQKFL